MPEKMAEVEAGKSAYPRKRILGIDFFTGTLAEAVELGMKGGLVVVPSGPGLAVDYMRSKAYRDALLSADMVITDSGFMVLLWRIIGREKLPRHSGLAFMRCLLANCRELRERGSSFWIMPSEEEAERNRDWLRQNGFPVDDEDIYIAPHYGPGKIKDDSLLERLAGRSPRVIVLAIGGGVQERLGIFLRRNLKYTAGIFCTGAAIAFLSGGQVHIPRWADRMMLGWLFRILSNPFKYWKRYWNALALLPILLKYRREEPPMIDEKA